VNLAHVAVKIASYAENFKILSLAPYVSFFTHFASKLRDFAPSTHPKYIMFTTNVFAMLGGHMNPCSKNLTKFRYPSVYFLERGVTFFGTCVGAEFFLPFVGTRNCFRSSSPPKPRTVGVKNKLFFQNRHQ
jgi:hypothetical protein